MKNSNITSLERVLTLKEKDVDKMIKTFHQSDVELLPGVEKNLQLMVGEDQIHLLGSRHGRRIVVRKSDNHHIEEPEAKESFISRAWDYLNNRPSSLLFDNVLENCINHQYDHRRV
jgi:hypothetical protein